MKDIPIIFSAPMVLALLRGRKTMTRRLALTSKVVSREITPLSYRSTIKVSQSPWQKVNVGDRLWVRENFAPIYSTPMSAIYRADGEKQPGTCCGCAWKPSIHMPRSVSRLTLIVTATKIERLQDISEADAISEGWPYVLAKQSPLNPASKNSPQFWFAGLWMNLHGADGWEANPEVVALSFRVVKENIDKIST